MLQETNGFLLTTATFSAVEIVGLV